MPLLPIVPELVSDTTLKAVSVESGGNSYLRITGETEPDLTPITATLGSPSDLTWNGSDSEASVISILKGIYNKAPSSSLTLNKILAGNETPLTGFTYTSSSTSVTFNYNEVLVEVQDNSQYNFLTVTSYRVVSGSTATVSISGSSYYKSYAPGVDVGTIYLTDENKNIKICTPIGSKVENTNYASGTIRWYDSYDLNNIVS